MNKWLAVVVLSAFALFAAMGLKSVTTHSATASGWTAAPMGVAIGGLPMPKE